MIDPTGRIVTEVRSDSAVAAMTTKVAPAKPEPGWALGPGQYQRFIVIVRTGAQRHRQLGAQEVRYAARCYGQGSNPAQDAAALAGTVSDAIHRKGPRVSAGGIGIWASYDDGGDGAAQDPVTQQPYETVIIEVHAADRPIV